MPEVQLEQKIFDIPENLKKTAYIDNDKYLAMYDESVKDPEGFWSKQAEEFLTWDKKWNKVLDWDFTRGHIEWFRGGKINVSANCLDRHLIDGNADKVAILWEGNEPSEIRKLTYRDLYQEVCRAANVLKQHGVKKGDTVAIYMPMIPELAITMLACTRIGAIHSIVFGGFSSDALRDRINDAGSKVLVTADGTFRGKKPVPLKEAADAAIAGKDSPVEHVIVVRRNNMEVKWNDARDVWWHDEMKDARPVCPYEVMDAEDPLFILYTSGSTGKPKGVMHSTGGYLLHAAITHKYVFDCKPEDIYWCTADIGWVTGHSYIVYGPLTNGATTIMFEGVPNYPEVDRFWDIVERHKVNIFYTAPTAIRAIAKEGSEPVRKHDLSSLRVLGTVGEPINPEAWMWYFNEVGGGRCTIVDTWWQTETGGIMITPLPGATKIKPGSATRPFFGVQPVLVDDAGNELQGVNEGNLCIKFPWPGITRSVYKNHSRFIDTYFSSFPGKYFTGDGCRRDADGYYWITGRVDDVINVSGHRMGTAEVESALVSHASVAEAAVVGFPHAIKGQGIYAFVTLNTGIEKTDALVKELVAHVRKEIGPIATPDHIQYADGLPKTRSGKIMRRILKKIAVKDFANLGDTSTLADPAVVDDLVKNFKG
ncbi:acetate--CoA ligase [Myxococcota bacterium]|nr:acetate--CoA ligase [Myxococcota bacterium]MBU1413568.1 acetate--CoA ligase [Myxococcota bacterium]MBU1512339.1 acetate--CoA ligase [Myxococcota bacterium]